MSVVQCKAGGGGAGARVRAGAAARARRRRRPRERREEGGRASSLALHARSARLSPALHNSW